MEAGWLYKWALPKPLARGGGTAYRTSQRVVMEETICRVRRGDPLVDCLIINAVSSAVLLPPTKPKDSGTT